MLTFYCVFVTVWKSKFKTVSYNMNSENITAAWERCLIEERIENLNQSHFFYPGMDKVQITEEDFCFKKRKRCSEK